MLSGFSIRAVWAGEDEFRRNEGRTYLADTEKENWETHDQRMEEYTVPVDGCRAETCMRGRITRLFTER